MGAFPQQYPCPNVECDCYTVFTNKPAAGAMRGYGIPQAMPAVLDAARRLGYDLSEEDGAKVYEAFQRIAAHKGSVGSKELDAIVAAAALQVPPAYKLQSYVINAGNTIGATAHLKLTKHDKPLEGVSVGDGPIDASFLALDGIVGCHYELDDFQIQAVTEGREAMTPQWSAKMATGSRMTFKIAPESMQPSRCS